MGNKRFIVDDWGMSPAINEAALYLAERGHLYGISVLPQSRFYSYKLNEILATGVKVGCHANFTFDISEGVKPNRLQWITVTQRIVSAAAKGLFFSEKIASILEQQAQWVKNHVGQLDYLDGHHHIHLYPGILGASKKLCSDLGIPFRVVADKRFKSNFTLAMFAKSRSHQSEYFECLYLSKEEHEDKNLLREKLNKSKGQLIAIHPATREDFIENGVMDQYIAGRVCQFSQLKAILEI